MMLYLSLNRWCITFALEILSLRFDAQVLLGRPRAFLHPLKVYSCRWGDTVTFGPFTFVFGLTEGWIRWVKETGRNTNENLEHIS